MQNLIGKRLACPRCEKVATVPVDGPTPINESELPSCADPSMSAKRPDRESDSLELVVQAVHGLSHAWRRHIIHRDIKPGNLIITSRGVLKIADFGVAKALSLEATAVTQTGTMLGTPHYMGPEQGNTARDLDFRADQYSLGATFYRCATGQVPFEGSLRIQVAITAATETLPGVRSVNPTVPPHVATVIEKMLARQKEDRYGTWAELRDVLQSLRRGQAVRTSHAATAIACPVDPPVIKIVKTNLADQRSIRTTYNGHDEESPDEFCEQFINHIRVTGAVFVYDGSGKCLGKADIKGHTGKNDRFLRLLRTTHRDSVEGYVWWQFSVSPKLCRQLFCEHEKERNEPRWILSTNRRIFCDFSAPRSRVCSASSNVALKTNGSISGGTGQSSP